MTPRECLAQFAETGLLPADAVDDILRVTEWIDTRVNAGELSEDEALRVLDHHAERVIESRRATEGEFSAGDKALAVFLVQALEANGAPS